MRTLELVLFFFYSREKILCVVSLLYFLFWEKKGFENRVFEIRGMVKYPPFRTLIIIYNIYIYI
jgi:hypothetical protein